MRVRGLEVPAVGVVVQLRLVDETAVADRSAHASL